MNTKLHGMVLAAMLLAVAGCATKKPLPVESDPSVFGDDSSGAGADTGAIDRDRIRSDGMPEFENSTADALIIYFDYDKSEVRPEYTDLLTSHARRLASDSTLRLRLEGHGDERGSREYNIGLGERRAQAVRRLLLIQGASSAQISTVSYGEERPAAFGSTESDYQKNRRVELSYRLGPGR